jgi:hypothetical protein
VKLFAPEAVRPFVKKGKKNDPADAAALCVAASRPDMIFVPVKNIEQQGILSARSLLVKQQTMLANAMRGLATEFGLTVPQGIGRLEELMALVDADKAFPVKARQVFTGLFDQCRALAESIRAFELEIVAHARQDEIARRLATIPGVGPITASLIAATVVDIGLSKVHGTSRPGSAWCRDSIPPAERPALVGSPKRATGRSAGCLSSVPRRWFTEPRNARVRGRWADALKLPSFSMVYTGRTPSVCLCRSGAGGRIGDCSQEQFRQYR